MLDHDTPETMFANAMVIAAEAHRDQRDKGGHPYITHPLRVCDRVRQSRDYELMTIALLHDVFEDSDYELADLRKQGFSARIHDALVLLTHNHIDNYDVYIEKIATNKDAILVKLADLTDNSDITRMKGLRSKDFDRLIKYNKAYAYLIEKLEQFK